MANSQDSEEFPFPVVVCHSDERGDGLAASRNLSMGELVLRTAPIAAVPKDGCLLTVCGCCFRRGGLEGVELEVCAGCVSVAHCQRCRQSGLAAARHDKDECAAVSMLMRLHSAGAGEQGDNKGKEGGGSKVEVKGRGKRAKTSSPSNTESVGLLKEDTATLRLVLAVGCYLARQRRAEQQRRQRSKARRKAAAAAAPSASVSDSQSDTDESDEEKSDGDLYGSRDVIQDSPADVEQLHGEPEDLGPEEGPRFTAACTTLKAVQPACARASLDAWLSWAVKIHLNEHDINRPALGGGGPSGEQEGAQEPQGVQGAGPSSAGVSSGGGRTTRGHAAGAQQGAAGRKKRGRGNEGAAAQPQAAVPLQQPGMEAVGEGLFPFTARLNHSCVPNVRHTVDEWGCLETRVCVPEGVKKGEELLAAYIKPEAPRDLRRSHLLERYGFDCACPRCLSGK